ncbi:response regulator transcription factor [soil metagenome]
MQAIKLIIADDHQLLLDGIVSLLQSEKNLLIVATAANGYEALDLIDKKDADICILDINMPLLDGIEAARLIKEKKPGLKIIILTNYNDKEFITEMLQIGVSGYILKNSTRQELIEAINKVAAGGLYFSNEVHNSIMENYLKHLNRKKEYDEAVILTQREVDVLQLLGKGYNNEKIANELGISYRTVETHRKNMMQKTKSHNEALLLKFAYSKGFIK